MLQVVVIFQETFYEALKEEKEMIEQTEAEIEELKKKREAALEKPKRRPALAVSSAPKRRVVEFQERIASSRTSLPILPMAKFSSASTPRSAIAPPPIKGELRLTPSLYREPRPVLSLGDKVDSQSPSTFQFRSDDPALMTEVMDIVDNTTN